MKTTDVRSKLTEALELDLVGPGKENELENEVLPQAPSRWYLTGFLVPIEAAEEQAKDETADDELDEHRESGGTDDAIAPEPAAAKRGRFSSSMGLSVLASPETSKLQVRIHWGDYLPEYAAPGEDVEGGEEETGKDGGDGESGKTPPEDLRFPSSWRRDQREADLNINLPTDSRRPFKCDVPESSGLQLVLSVRPVGNTGEDGGTVPAGTRSVSVFLVNFRQPAPDNVRDQAFIFQAELEVLCQEGFVARPDPRGIGSDDWDERVADLQYRDDGAYAVGHNIATLASIEADGRCTTVCTTWIPRAEVERVAPEPIEGVELSMEALSEISDGNDANEKLGALVNKYRSWIEDQKKVIPTEQKRRSETGDELIRRASVAADRIEAGIKLLEDPEILEAFRIANSTMAKAARQRFSRLEGKEPSEIAPPAWRPFQLAFILM